jgi:hypothetical protein
VAAAAQANISHAFNDLGDVIGGNRHRGQTPANN